MIDNRKKNYTSVTHVTNQERKQKVCYRDGDSHLYKYSQLHQRSRNLNKQIVNGA